MKCQLIMTGDELMTGATIDSNSAYIAEQLHHMGISVSKIVTLGDSLAELAHEIYSAAQQVELVIINGGLGPTDDDLTAMALANAFQKPLQNHPAAEQHIRDWCAARKVNPNQANLKQALLPAGSSILPNPLGSAPGIRYVAKNNRQGCVIFCTPGVPVEMRHMLQESIIPELKVLFPDSQENFTKRLQVFGMGESSIQQKIHDQLPSWPDEITLGFRAGMPTLEVKLTVNHKKFLSLRDHWEDKVRTLLGFYIIGEENDSLQSTVVEALTQKKQTITTAESCTGGLIASMITSISGSSKVFESGFVTYSNDIKQRILDVDTETLSQHGAVSKEVVSQMANGALKKSGADYAVAVSGIAGPEGGSAEKPVGTVWIAWGRPGGIKTHQFFYPAERKTFQQLAAAYALDLIRREILQITELPRYLKK
jgi:nicotinamide-nucleotide amidase